MSTPGMSRNGHPALPSTAAILDAFEYAWQHTPPAVMDSYVPPADSPLRWATLVDLVHSDMEYRWKTGLALPVPLGDYLERFPELTTDPAVLAELIQWECELRRRFDVNLKQTVPPPPLPSGVPGLGDTGATVYPSRFDAPPLPAELPSAGDYLILGQLGQGGMGVVYKARQLGLDRIVALKMILAGKGAGPEEIARFRAEAKAIALVKHPGIVEIYDTGVRDGMPFFSLEYCPGGSLADRMKKTPLSPEDLAGVVEGIARAVHAAHERGIVHRDLKPGNVLLAEDGKPKVTDFGLAKWLANESGLTVENAIMGTPSYMAPEQATSSKDAGPPADTWALGAILYEGLTGRPPFLAADHFAILKLVVSEEPVSPRLLNPTVPPDLETICLKCLRKEIEGRYTSAEALAEDLRRWRAGEPIEARPAGRVEKAWKWARRHPAWAGLVSTSVVALAALVSGSVVYGLYQGELRRQTQQRERAGDFLSAALGSELDAREALEQGKEAEARRYYQRAVTALREGQVLARALPKADDLTSELADRLVQAQDKLTELETRKDVEDKAAREQREWQLARDQLREGRNEVLTHDVGVSDTDLATRRQQVCTLVPRVLAKVGIDAARLQAEGRLAQPGGESERQAATWCYEILLVWADAAEPALGDKLLSLAAALAQTHGLPPTRAWHQRRARILVAIKDVAGAKREEQLAKQQTPRLAHDHFLLALDHYRAAEVPEAIRSCASALEVQPEDFWPRYLLGLCHLRQAKWDAAEFWLGTALSARPDAYWPRVQRALALVKRKDYVFASEELDKAEPLAKDQLMRYVLHVTRAALWSDLKEWGRAAQEWTLAIREEPEGKHQACLSLAQAYSEDREYDAALHELDQLAERNLGDPEVYYTRAAVHALLGDSDAARQDYEQVVRLRRESRKTEWADAHARLGYLDFEANQFARAFQHADAAVRLDPASGLAHRVRAQVLFQLNRPDEAIRDLDEFLKRGQPNVEVYKARAILHHEKGEFLRAIELFSRALLEKRDAETLAYRGWSQLQSNAIRQAIDDFTEARKLDPRNSDALCGLAQAALRQNRVATAVTFAKEALEKYRKPTYTLFRRLAVVFARAAQLERRGSLERLQYEDRAAMLLTQARRLLPPEQEKRYSDELRKDKLLEPLMDRKR